jgi:hypothetical protein
MNHVTATFLRAHAAFKNVEFAIKQRAWNWYARRAGWNTCEACDDTRGGTIGNGQIIDGVLLCDYCHCDQMRHGRFWEVQPTEHSK